MVMAMVMMLLLTAIPGIIAFSADRQATQANRNRGIDNLTSASSFCCHQDCVVIAMLPCH